MALASSCQANALVSFLWGKLEHHRAHDFGPPAGFSMCAVVDDVHLASEGPMRFLRSGLGGAFSDACPHSLKQLFSPRHPFWFIEPCGGWNS